MQRNCTELTERLLKSLDKEYNVVDMRAVVEIITALERTAINKKVLEDTRLGKHINELRRKTGDVALAKRAKGLVRQWKLMVDAETNQIVQQQQQQQQQQQLQRQQQLEATMSMAPATQALSNGASTSKPQSPAARLISSSSKPRSPAALTKNLMPHSPMLREVTLPYKVNSPALSLHSNQSRSPNLGTASPAASPSSIKQLPPTNNYLNNRINSSSSSPKLSGTSCHNHSGSEAVPRTHSSNKRLRKDDIVTNKSINQNNKTQADELKESLGVYNNEPLLKKQRINGENINININKNINSKVPSPLITQELINHNNSDDSKPDVIIPPNNNDDVAAAVVVGPKKRGRKKGSKGIKHQNIKDGVKEKIESITRNPKVKKISEILADLQAANKSSSVALAAAAANLSTGTKLNTQSSVAHQDDNNDNDDDDDDDRLTSIGRKSSRITKLKTNINETDENSSNADKTDIINSKHEITVEEIMAKLPPLDIDSIRWSDDEYDDRPSSPQSVPPVTEVDIERLQEFCIEGLNGNFQLRLAANSKNIIQDNNDDDDGVVKKEKYLKRLGDEINDEREFHEWHEMLARPTCDGQILHILPYVIID